MILYRTQKEGKMGGKGSGRKSIRQPMITNYYVAWQSFLASKNYTRLHTTLVDHGIRQPYLDNILRVAFDAGWAATGTKIQIIPKTQDNATNQTQPGTDIPA